MILADHQIGNVAGTQKARYAYGGNSHKSEAKNYRQVDRQARIRFRQRVETTPHGVVDVHHDQKNGNYDRAVNCQ